MTGLSLAEPEQLAAACHTEYLLSSPAIAASAAGPGKGDFLFPS